MKCQADSPEDVGVSFVIARGVQSIAFEDFFEDNVFGGVPFTGGEHLQVMCGYQVDVLMGDSIFTDHPVFEDPAILSNGKRLPSGPIGIILHGHYGFPSDVGHYQIGYCPVSENGVLELLPIRHFDRRTPEVTNGTSGTDPRPQ